MGKLSESFNEELLNFIEKHNEDYRRGYDSPALFKEGDYIKVKEKRYINLSTNREDVIYRVLKVSPPIKFELEDWSGRVIEHENASHRYYVNAVLSSGVLSKKRDEFYFTEYDRVELFTGEKFTRVNNVADNWRRVDTTELNLLDLCREVDHVLEKLRDDKYKALLSKYSKEMMVSKSTLENNPIMMDVHKSIEKLKKFKTHIETVNLDS